MNGTSLLLLVVVSALGLLLDVVLEQPEASVSEKRSQVDTHGCQEVGVAEVDDFLEEVLEENSEHPNLLVSDKPARSMVHSVLRKGVHKRCTNIVQESVVQIQNFLFGLEVDFSRGFLLFEENGGQHVVVVLKEFIQLVEVGHAELHGLRQVLVSQLHVFLLFFSAVQ